MCTQAIVSRSRAHSVANFSGFKPPVQTCTFPQHVSADKELRDVSADVDEKLSNHSVNLNSRFDVYRAVKVRFYNTVCRPATP